MHIVKQGVSVFIRNNFIVNMLFINFARFLLIFFQIFKYISNFVKKTFKKIGQKAKHYIDFFYQDFPLKWLSETTDVLIWFENFIILGLMCFFFLLMIIFNIRKCIVLLKNMCPGCLVFQIFHKKNFLTTIRFFFFQIIIHLIFFTRIFLIHQENEFNIRKNFFFYQLSVCLFLMLDSYRLSLYAKFHIKKKNVEVLHVYTFKKILTYLYIQRYNHPILPKFVDCDLVILNLTKKKKMQIKFFLTNFNKKKNAFFYGKKWKNFTFNLSKKIKNFIDDITTTSVFSGMYLKKRYKEDTRFMLIANLLNQNIIYIVIIYIVYTVQKKDLDFFFFQKHQKTLLYIFLTSYVVLHILILPCLLK